MTDLITWNRRELHLADVAVDATWPIHRLSRLRTLRLERLQSDCLPESLWELPELRSLELAYTSDVVRLPDNIPPTAKLQSLRVESSRLRSLPETIGRLSDLTSLRINGKFLNGLFAICGSFALTTILETLDCQRPQAAFPG
jgi:Leucine-rich repeat (LRR) protein